MRKINLTLTGVLAVLTFVFTLGAGPIHAQVRTFAMPACPIKANTVPPTKTEIMLPDENPLGEPFSFAGTMQLTDQTGGTIFLMQYVAGVDVPNMGINLARTVKTIAHETFTLTFDKGCTATDPYGSNNCHWDWGQSVTQGYQGALQEDIKSGGKFIVDLKVDGINPVQFTCPVCGATCTIDIPASEQEQSQQGQNTRKMWDLMTQFTRLPLSLTTPLPLAARMLSSIPSTTN